MPPKQRMISKTTCPTNLCNDEEIKREVKFLDNLG